MNGSIDSWLPALCMALPIGERCAAMWFHATDIFMSVASIYIVLDTVGYKLSLNLDAQRYAFRFTHTRLTRTTIALSCSHTATTYLTLSGAEASPAAEPTAEQTDSFHSATAVVLTVGIEHSMQAYPHTYPHSQCTY